MGNLYIPGAKYHNSAKCVVNFVLGLCFFGYDIFMCCLKLVFANKYYNKVVL